MPGLTLPGSVWSLKCSRHTHGGFRSLEPFSKECGNPTFESRPRLGPACVYSISKGSVTGHSSDTRTLRENAAAQDTTLNPAALNAH